MENIASENVVSLLFQRQREFFINFAKNFLVGYNKNIIIKDDIIADGNCFYNAFNYALGNCEEEPSYRCIMDVRRDIYDAIISIVLGQNLSPSQLEFPSGITIHDLYLQKDNKTYTDDPILQQASQLYKTNIIILNPSEGRIEIISPFSSDGITIENINNNNTVILLREGEHFITYKRSTKQPVKTKGEFYEYLMNILNDDEYRIKLNMNGKEIPYNINAPLVLVTSNDYFRTINLVIKNFDILIPNFKYAASGTFPSTRNTRKSNKPVPKPRGNPVPKPRGNPVPKSKGNSVSKPRGNPVLKPRGNSVPKQSSSKQSQNYLNLAEPTNSATLQEIYGTSNLGIIGNINKTILQKTIKKIKPSSKYPPPRKKKQNKLQSKSGKGTSLNGSISLNN
jgi:hypothetical protein